MATPNKINPGYPQNIRLNGTDPNGNTTEIFSDGNGNLQIVIQDGSGNTLGTSSHPVRIDPTGTTVQPVSATISLPTSAATNMTNGSTSSSGWTNIISGVGGKTTRLWKLIVSVSAATNIGLGDGSSILFGPYYLTASGSIVLDISSEPWFVTAASASLQINNSNAVAIQYTTYTTQS